jgi:mitogen-activated protein kinase 7
MQRHTFTALNSTFVVDAEYQYVKELGQGAYGCVVAARHRRSGEGCAIKKITNINTKVRISRVYRSQITYSYSAYTHEEMSTRDQVSDLIRSSMRTAHLDLFVIEGFCITFVATRTSVENVLLDHLKLTDEQITCLYDMDIVFQPSGNFDEVYLYVRACLLTITLSAMT